MRITAQLSPEARGALDRLRRGTSRTQQDTISAAVVFMDWLIHGDSQHLAPPPLRERAREALIYASGGGDLRGLFQ